VEADDAYTGSHSREVVDLAMAVADELDLSAQERREVEFVALLHDVGKVRIPKEIINKPGKLTDVRFFSAGSGTVRVKIVVKSLLGVLSVLDGGTVTSGSTWKPSADVRLLLTNISGLLATHSISLRFVPANTTGVRIDDVFLDPWKSAS
jgi:HD domain